LLMNAEFRRCIDAIDAHEADRAFCKHGLNHLLDTARIAYILVLENGLNISKGMVYATALLHDIGRYDEYYHGIPHDQAHDRAKKNPCGMRLFPRRNQGHFGSDKPTQATSRTLRNPWRRA
jgi:hypothetical protein